MAIFNTLTNDPQLPVLLVLVVISLLGLVTSLITLLLERQGSQQLQQRLTDLGHQLIEQQEDYNKLEKLQFLGAQRQQRMDQVLQDIYGLIESNSQQLDRIKNQPTPNSTTSTEVPSQTNYEHAIRMAKEGMSGEKIQHICGLTEGEVNLILDLHQ
jgi:type II secretory pathway pseudopilin PulG